MIGFFIGLSLGGMVGVFIMCACFIAKESDRERRNFK